MAYVILFFSIVNLLLGLIIMLRPPYTRSNISFFVFALFASLWTFNNFYLRIEPNIFFLRLAYALGIVVGTLGLIWASYFLNNKVKKYILFGFVPITILGTLPTLLSGWVINSLGTITTFGYEGTTGRFFSIYSLYVGTLILAIILSFLVKLRKEKDSTRRSQITLVLFGALIFAVVSLAVSFIVPTFFGTFNLTIFDNLSFSIFLMFIVFATLKFHLFNLKIIAAELFVFSLWIFILIRTILSTGIDRVLNGVLFGVSAVVGLLLIRSVIKEVESKEEIQRLATDLRSANEKLKELDTLKSQFLSIASHDLRAPLTAIRNFMSLLMDGTYGKLPGAAEEGVRQVSDRATEMAKSVDTYLNVSRIEQGRMKYDFIDTDLAKIVADTVSIFKPIAEKKGLAFTLTGGKLPLPIKADIGKLQEVFNNLVDNSIKYTPTGSITMSIEHRGSLARVTIQDTGVGMSQTTISKLFGLFSTGENSRKVNTSSTGVGLYISKAHVEAHGGKVWAESDGEGKGSRFIVELPLK